MMGVMQWTAVLAVKQLTNAKSRLADRFDEDTRRDLVLAMLADTVAAVLPEVVTHAVLVSPDPDVLKAANSLGVQPLAEPQGGAGSINAAFALGLAAAWDGEPTRCALVLQADLPALRPAEIIAAVAAAERVLLAGADTAFVADRDGTGTTALFARPATAAAVPLRFGARSAAAHAAAGAVPLDGQWPGLRTDVDTADDVRVVAQLGVGPATTPLLAHRVPQ